MGKEGYRSVQQSLDSVALQTNPEILTQLKGGAVHIARDQRGLVVTGDGNTIVFERVPEELLTAFVPGAEDSTDSLTTALAQYLQRLRDMVASHDDPEPYRGLFAYRMQDANRFYGREEDVAQLRANVERAQLVWLHGPSGTGKTSLILAGLIPELLDEGVPVHVRLRRRDPVTALKIELLGEKLADSPYYADYSLGRFLRVVGDELQGRTLYIIFDQFEEFFIWLDKDVREAFARSVVDCVSDLNLPVKFVFVLRSEYYGYSMVIRDRLSEFVNVEQLLQSISLETARKVIEEPSKSSRLRGFRIDTEVVQAILSDLGTEDVYPPQLQLVCRYLYETAKEQAEDQEREAKAVQITLDDYESIGRMAGILRHYLQTILENDLPPHFQATARYLLSKLAALNGQRRFGSLDNWLSKDTQLHRLVQRELSHHFRRSGRSSTELVSESERNRLIINVLNALSLRRVVIAIPTRQGDIEYELVHDYLAEEIAAWLEEAEEGVAQLNQVLAEADDAWQRYGRLRSISQAQLDAFAANLANPQLHLTDVAKRLLLYSAVENEVRPLDDWMLIAGSAATDWLREAIGRDSLPHTLRRNAAHVLGGRDDRETFNFLLDEAMTGDLVAQEILVGFLDAAHKSYRLPVRLRLSLWFYRVRLGIAEARDARIDLRRNTVILALICTLILTVSVQGGDLNLSGTAGLLIIFGGVLSLTAVLFSEALISTQYIVRRTGRWKQLLALGPVGAIAGFPIYLLLTFEIRAAITGITVGIVVWMAANTKWWRPYRPALFGLLAGMLTFALVFVIYEGDDPYTMVSITNALLFSSVYSTLATRRIRAEPAP